VHSQARLALDTDAAATRLVVLKLHYPTADLTRIMQRQPHLLLQDVAVLEDNAKQVRRRVSGRVAGCVCVCVCVCVCGGGGVAGVGGQLECRYVEVCSFRPHCRRGFHLLLLQLHSS
jgi:hypothetical protein